MRKAATAIEITSTEIKLFQAKTLQGKDVVTFCDVRPVEGGSEETVAKLLKEMIASLPDAAEDVCLLLPRREVILRQMKFPTDDVREIEDMIGLQLLNNIPYPAEDVLYRHFFLDKDGRGYRRVLVIIIHKNTAKKYYRIMQRAGVRDGKLTIHSLGVSGWLDYQTRMRKDLSETPVMVLNIDQTHAEACFCAEGKLFYSRNILYGSDRLKVPSSEELTGEVKLSLAAYDKDGLGPAVGKILVLAAPKDGEALKAPLQKACGLAVEVLDPLNGVFGVPDEKRENLKGFGAASVTACIGALLSGIKDRINLAPGEVHEAKRKKTDRRRLARFLVLLAVVVVLSAAGQMIDINKKSGYLRSLENEIAGLKPRVEEINHKAKLVANFEGKFNNYGFIPDLMSELTRVTPEKVSFRTLSLDSKRDLLIQGYAETHADINDFQTQLIQSAFFSDVDLKFSTKRKIANMPVMDFKIASHLAQAGEREL